MKKNLLLCLFICFCYQSYSQIYNWMISSDISPLSRSGNERVLNSPSGLNLEWRNRVGFKLGDQTMMGLSTGYRYYDLKEITYLFPDAKVGGRQYQTNNNLFGIGTFLTQYYHITPKFHLQTTAYLQVDQGKGTYKHYLLRSSDTMGIFEGVLQPTQLVEISTYREKTSSQDWNLAPAIFSPLSGFYRPTSIYCSTRISEILLLINPPRFMESPVQWSRMGAGFHF